MLKKRRIEVEGFGAVESIPGELFLEVLNRERLDLHNDCGGHLKCGKCRIVFRSPPPEPLPGDRKYLNPEALAAGTRLACIHQIRADCAITIPDPPELELAEDL